MFMMRGNWFSAEYYAVVIHQLRYQCTSSPCPTWDKQVHVEIWWAVHPCSLWGAFQSSTCSKYWSQQPSMAHWWISVLFCSSLLLSALSL